MRKELNPYHRKTDRTRVITKGPDTSYSLNDLTQHDRHKIPDPYNNGHINKDLSHVIETCMGQYLLVDANTEKVLIVLW